MGLLMDRNHAGIYPAEAEVGVRNRFMKSRQKYGGLPVNISARLYAPLMKGFMTYVHVGCSIPSWTAPAWVSFSWGFGDSLGEGLDKLNTPVITSLTHPSSHQVTSKGARAGPSQAS